MGKRNDKVYFETVKRVIIVHSGITEHDEPSPPVINSHPHPSG